MCVCNQLIFFIKVDLKRSTDTKKINIPVPNNRALLDVAWAKAKSYIYLTRPHSNKYR